MGSKKTSLFDGAPAIRPIGLKKGIRASDLVDLIGETCFEARNVAAAARLLVRMIDEGDTIWLGISGAGIAGGLGGLVSGMIRRGYISAICSTGAQIYHDLHFAFDLPVKAICPHADDDALRAHGDTRIYDIGIRDVETLEAQDALICRFIEESYDDLSARPLSSADFNYALGRWSIRNAPHPERSFTCMAARYGVPVFWDSHTNHSIALSIARLELAGKPLRFPIEADITLSAAIVYTRRHASFVELGGGGPKNFIQQTGPNLSQVLGLPYKGADRGIQISVADPRDGGLSGCTFGEAVTWKKYKRVDAQSLVQVWGEYSVIYPLLAAYADAHCKARKPQRLYRDLPALREKLVRAIGSA